MKIKNRITKHEVKLTFKEEELTVIFEHHPAEKPETGPEAQYPGCDASIEIEFIEHNGVDVFDKHKASLTDIEQMIWDDVFEYVRTIK
jgi:hypothetical protein